MHLGSLDFDDLLSFVAHNWPDLLSSIHRFPLLQFFFEAQA